MKIKLNVFKLLFPPSEPAVSDAIYLIQRDAQSPVELYVTNEAGNLQSFAKSNTSPILLASEMVDLNSGVRQTTYTVPASRRMKPTQVELDVFSDVPVNAEITMGWNTGANNVLVDPVHLADLVTNVGDYANLFAQPKSIRVGTAGQTLGLIASTMEGSDLTARVNIFGYLTDTDGVPLPNV